jgi:hypothetical protein
MYVFYFLTSPPRDYALQNVSTFFKNVGFLSVFSSTFFKSLQHFFKMLDNIFGVPTYYNISVFKLFQHFFFIFASSSSKPAAHRSAGELASGQPQGRSHGAPANTAREDLWPAFGCARR